VKKRKGRTMPPIRNPAATLEYQIAQEKASALGRLGRELERALSALRAFDTAHGRFAGLTGELSKRRDNLVAEAAQALWYLVVQRDACGMCNSTYVMADYAVPSEVQNRMGPVLTNQTAVR
jgi:hypothetical protein